MVKSRENVKKRRRFCDDILYKKLLDKRRQITSVLKDNDTGKVNVDMLSDSDRAMLKQLDQDIANLYIPT